MSEVVLQVPYRGEHAYVRVDHAALYGTTSVEIAGWQLSRVTGMPISAWWGLIDILDLPQMAVGTTDTWTPPPVDPKQAAAQ
ncbi:hypothetical protein [Micromonospora sp. WMMD1082]|uniref:hypothetical protein n=1 Tax=Micromonospora sp. WMMD1082 TaxID=3016104 RepID=UPI0024168F9A|nr:hypothetical protein [Micromonospora sp. WMMD1082]MDG4795989.1 hypothetical protein [Micromonospora sp. WMMD1082]